MASKRPPSTTPHGREQQMIALAVDAAEKILREPNPPSQLVTHYLKLGSSREMLEQEKIQKENELLEAKKEAMASAARVEELMTEAINAFRTYSGQQDHHAPEAYDD